MSAAQLEQLLTELRVQLAPETYQLVESLLRTLQWIMVLLEEKQTTLARLQRVLFGAKTETTEQLFPKASPADSSSATGLFAIPKPNAKAMAAMPPKITRGLSGCKYLIPSCAREISAPTASRANSIC